MSSSRLKNSVNWPSANASWTFNSKRKRMSIWMWIFDYVENEKKRKYWTFLSIKQNQTLWLRWTHREQTYPQHFDSKSLSQWQRFYLICRRLQVGLQQTFAVKWLPQCHQRSQQNILQKL
jgi:hypothetical protein